MLAESEKLAAKARSMPDEAKSPLRWYLLGFTLLGGAVGYFAGSSQTPVIGTLLPILFTLVGGTGGLYLAQADLKSPESLWRLRILGQSLALFTAASLVGSCYGISLRTGQSVFSFFSGSLFSGEAAVALPGASKRDATAAMQLVLLRARLQALGASKEEQRLVLDEAAVALETMSDAKLAPRLRNLGTQANIAAKSVEAATAASSDAPRPAQFLPDFLRAYAEDTEKWSTQMDAGRQVPLASIKGRLDNLRDELNNFLYRRSESAQWIAKQDEAREQLWELQWSVVEEGHRLGTIGWTASGPLSAEADRLLEIVYGKKPASAEQRPAHAD